MSSAKKVIISLGTLLLVLRITQIDFWLLHELSHRPNHPEFPELAEIPEANEWLELVEEDPEVAVRQAHLLVEEDRYEELAEALHYLSADRKLILIERFFCINQSGLLFPNASFRWLHANDAFQLIQTYGMGIDPRSENEQLFYLHGLSLYRRGHSNQFTHQLVSHTPQLIPEMLRILHYAMTVNPEETSFSDAYSVLIESIPSDILDIYIKNIDEESLFHLLPEDLKHVLVHRLRREPFSFYSWVVFRFIK